MFNIDELIEKAKKNNELKSDMDVNRLLGMKGPVVSQWRTGRSLPSDETLYKLCDAAGYDKEQIMKEMVLLAIHRTASTDQVQANEAWRGMLDTLKRSLGMFALVAAVGLMAMNTNTNSAYASMPNFDHQNDRTIYIMGNK